MIKGYFTTEDGNRLEEELKIEAEYLNWCRVMDFSEDWGEGADRERCIRDGTLMLAVYVDADYAVFAGINDSPPKIEGHANFLAVIYENHPDEVVCGMHYISDSVFDFVHARTYEQLIKKMAEHFGYVPFGDTEPFEVRCTDEQVIEFFQLRNLTPSHYYVEEWKDRIRSGKWLYVADEETAQALYHVGIIDKKMLDIYHNMKELREAESCEEE